MNILCTTKESWHRRNRKQLFVYTKKYLRVGRDSAWHWHIPVKYSRKLVCNRFKLSSSEPSTTPMHHPSEIISESRFFRRFIVSFANLFFELQQPWLTIDKCVSNISSPIVSVIRVGSPRRAGIHVIMSNISPFLIISIIGVESTHLNFWPVSSKLLAAVHRNFRPPFIGTFGSRPSELLAAHFDITFDLVRIHHGLFKDLRRRRPFLRREPFIIDITRDDVNQCIPINEEKSSMTRLAH